MKWVVEPDPAAYAERVLPWLGRDPVLTTVPATILAGSLERGDDTAWRAWLADGAGEVAAVALRTPGRGLVLTALPPGAAALLAGIAEPRLPGAAGPAADVEAVATAYARRHGARAVPGIRQRLFRLGPLTPPPPPGGRLRAATDADVELGARWFDDFCAEAGLRHDPDALATSRRVVAQGRLDFWAVGGAPVSMVGHSLTVAGVTRIGPVWTPPEHRRRGYAAAATAAVA